MVTLEYMVRNSSILSVLQNYHLAQATHETQVELVKCKESRMVWKSRDRNETLRRNFGIDLQQPETSFSCAVNLSSDDANGSCGRTWSHWSHWSWTARNKKKQKTSLKYFKFVFLKKNGLIQKLLKGVHNADEMPVKVLWNVEESNTATSEMLQWVLFCAHNAKQSGDRDSRVRGSYWKSPFSRSLRRLKERVRKSPGMIVLTNQRDEEPYSLKAYGSSAAFRFSFLINKNGVISGSLGLKPSVSGW